MPQAANLYPIPLTHYELRNRYYTPLQHLSSHFENFLGNLFSARFSASEQAFAVCCLVLETAAAAGYVLRAVKFWITGLLLLG